MSARLLLPGDAGRIQEMVAAHLDRRGVELGSVMLDHWGFVPHRDPLTYGGRVRLASGRATCRGCGRKIAAGERALQFEYSFTQAGGFTATAVWLHLPRCPR